MAGMADIYSCVGQLQQAATLALCNSFGDSDVQTEVTISLHTLFASWKRINGMPFVNELTKEEVEAEFVRQDKAFNKLKVHGYAPMYRLSVDGRRFYI